MATKPDGLTAAEFAELRRLKPADAMRWMQERAGGALSFSWQDLWQSEHSHLFTISRLARLDDGVVNQLIGGLTGSKVSLSAMDYRRLIDLDINLLEFTDALSTDLGVEVGDYDQLLATQVDAGRALRVLERVAGGQDGGALGKLASASVGTKVRLGDLIGVEARAPDGIREGLDASLRPALEVWVMVQSVPEPGLALLTCGRRDVSYDLEMPVPVRWARRAERMAANAPVGWSISALNDQHAYLRFDPAGPVPAVGDRVALGVSHPCTTFDKWRWLPLVEDDWAVSGAISTRF